MTPADDSPTRLRSDAARNRTAIIATARSMADAGEPVQLNAVARAAEVGVGTVYRHFPTVEDLLETLVDDRFISLTADAAAAADAIDPVAAFRTFLRASVLVYVEDELFATAATNARPARQETRRLRMGLLTEFSRLLERVADADGLRASVGADDAMALVCGIAYAVRLSPERPRAVVAERYLGALLDGLVQR
ncbi:TetR/AcrR family transcriptional regulator [Plantibacter sp. YIM 135347]|uniref:TetR/AcrR family transcriptional regulator n=1 Tax=Plantibacter sp. YIM 135347 TaxID=3423919 RepID=UPI003D33A6B2